MLPIALFIMDFAMKVITKVDSSDIGADMAFLAVATFVSLIIEEHNKLVVNLKITVFFLIISIMPWFASLWLISSSNNRIVDIFNFEFNLRYFFTPLSWVVGLTSLVIFGITTHEIIRNTRKI